MPRYILIPETEVEPERVATVLDTVRRALTELALGASPEIRWFADTRELPRERVAAALEVYVPSDGVGKAGSVPPYVTYSAEQGWNPNPPVMLLSRTQGVPETALHELRHLWQIKAGLYDADTVASQELEDDADRWAAAALTRIGVRAE